MNWSTLTLTATLVFATFVSSGYSRSDVRSRIQRPAPTQKTPAPDAATSTNTRQEVSTARVTQPSTPLANPAPSPRPRYPAPTTTAQPATSPQTLPKKPGFFARVFGRNKKPETAQPSSTGPVVPPTVYHTQVLSRSNRSNTSLVVDVSKQKAYLLVDGDVGLVTPVSTARPGKYTPRGTFRMGERVRSGKISTIYGVGMPYWMRLGGSLYGVHAGFLPGYPASAGCVRLPVDAAQTIFDNTRSGTQVSIYSSWGNS